MKNLIKTEKIKEGMILMKKTLEEYAIFFEYKSNIINFKTSIINDSSFLSFDLFY
jgi:hypothetical protein